MRSAHRVGWWAVELGIALTGRGKRPAATGQSGDDGGLWGRRRAGRTDGAMGSTGTGGGASAGTGSVNGPCGAGPIISFGVDEGLSSVAWSGSALLAISGDDALIQSLGTSGHPR